MINSISDAIRATEVSIKQLPFMESSKDPKNLEHDLGYCSIVLAALRTVQEREKPCGYTWYGEGQIDYDGWEEPIGVCILACNGCGWTFYGDCFTYDAPGFDYKGEQVPNYCPHCGRKLGDEETAYHSRPEEG